MVTNYVSVFQMQLGDLRYLSNLEEIQGLRLTGTAALAVAENPTMSTLGLLNLRKIVNGAVLVSVFDEEGEGGKKKTQRKRSEF